MMEMIRYMKTPSADMSPGLQGFLINFELSNLLTEVVHLWAKGTKFADICQYTDVQEGSIVRTIVRLDEMCRDVRNAARIMGDSALYEKMEAASAAIKRDICFSASLYVAGTS